MWGWYASPCSLPRFLAQNMWPTKGHDQWSRSPKQRSPLASEVSRGPEGLANKLPFLDIPFCKRYLISGLPWGSDNGPIFHNEQSINGMDKHSLFLSRTVGSHRRPLYTPGTHPELSWISIHLVHLSTLPPFLNLWGSQCYLSAQEFDNHNFHLSLYHFSPR